MMKIYYKLKQFVLRLILQRKLKKAGITRFEYFAESIRLCYGNPENVLNHIRQPWQNVNEIIESCKKRKIERVLWK